MASKTFIVSLKYPIIPKPNILKNISITKKIVNAKLI